MDYTAEIATVAQAAGVPPAIAIAVAEVESGYTPPQQYNADGSLVVGSHGEVGMFQLMPATAAGLGVDPSDPAQNIAGGVAFLAQMLGQFGSPAGLYAYNWGPGNVQAWQAGQAQLPSSVESYGNLVLAKAAAAAVPPGSGSPSGAAGAAPPNSGVGIGLAALVVGGLVLLALVT